MPASMDMKQQLTSSDQTVKTRQYCSIMNHDAVYCIAKLWPHRFLELFFCLTVMLISKGFDLVIILYLFSRESWGSQNQSTSSTSIGAIVSRFYHLTCVCLDGKLLGTESMTRYYGIKLNSKEVALSQLSSR